eukprot:m51a1_g4462 Dna replication licensing factor MCM5 (745) ;mRNA; f:194787-198113
MSAAFDEGSVVYSDNSAALGDPGASLLSGDAIAAVAEPRFLEFLRSFSQERNGAFVYREQLRQRSRLRDDWIDVDLDDLRAFDELLAAKFQQSPTSLLPSFEAAVGKALAAERAVKPGEDPQDPDEDETRFQLLFHSSSAPIAIRSLISSNISQLVKVHGIVVSASRVQAKPTSVVVQCRNCQNRRVVHVRPGLATPQLPRQCDSAKNQRTGATCPLDPYVIIPGESTFVDHQVLKLQESPESVPTGELPRTILLSADRALVGASVPGSRISVVGVYTVMAGSSKNASQQAGSASIRAPYVRVLGITAESDGVGRSSHLFRPEEESEFIAMSRSPGLLDALAASTAPAIYGHTDIKKAVLCQLFGGSVKVLPDGVRLRGDINILLLGDPGTAKSQLLKFVEKAAPIGVYTSGKGSSAAGLTASVIRDGHTREFYLEGGAMVLADGGVVCIDEFDKMNPMDRVAIHEAMEQQTISIAKAGITTILNSRTAVLAAANPVFGRYDDMKDAAENIDFQTTILSRFDMIFLIRDRRDAAHDRSVAQHVIQIHTEGRGATGPVDSGVYDIKKLKRYVAYCKAKCAPRISEGASRMLADFFVKVRHDTRQASRGENQSVGGRASKIPITVRQLEAIVRISESLAKMQLLPVATEGHVTEAIRLFNTSTVDALNTGIAASEQLSPELVAEITNVEGAIKRVVPVGSSIAERQLVFNFSKQFSQMAIRRAINAMVKRDELEYKRQRHYIYRKR